MKQIITLLIVVFVLVRVHGQKFDSLALTPPMGWNSWNTFEVDIHEDMIKQMVDIMVTTGLRDAGYEYIVVDDGWEALSRDQDGHLVPDPEKFPNGMKALADYVHANGFKFGIHNCAGNTTCNGFPGGRGHEYQDARLYASWGVDYLKYDWCDHGTANAPETYKTMRDALFAAGRPVVYSLCEWGDNKPWLWAQDIGHLWRTTGDITDCYSCQGEYDMGLSYIVRLQEGLENYAGPDHWNDPDMLEVGNDGLTIAESRSHFSIWCMLAAPLMMGNDLRTMSSEVLTILTNKEAIAVDQDPLGKQASLFMKQIDKLIYTKELANGDWAICWHNAGNSPFTQRINWKHFTFLTGEYEVYDIWNKKLLGTTKKNIEADIQSHDVLFLRLKKK